MEGAASDKSHFKTIKEDVLKYVFAAWMAVLFGTERPKIVKYNAASFSLRSTEPSYYSGFPNSWVIDA